MSTVAEQYFERQDDNYIERPSTDFEGALSDVAHVSRVLHGVESGGELSAETLYDLCVCLFNAQRRLAAMQGVEGRVR